MARTARTGWDELLTQAELASLLRVHPSTLRRWAQSGDSPRETRIGGLVRYAESDVHAWLAMRRAREECA